MKRTVCLILVFICIVFSGCGADKKINEKNKKVTAEYPEFLYAHDWINYDEECTEEISFNSEGEFMYFCGCGEPVGDYDLYDSYSYFPEEGLIKLSGSGYEEDVSVIYYDESYLCLLLGNNNFQIFMDAEFAYNEYAPHEDMEIYADNGWIFLYVLEYSGDMLKAAPFDYDGDARESFAEYITELELTDDAEFAITETTVQNGVYDTVSSELADGELVNIGEFYNVGYLHITPEGKVDSVMFYGKTEIW